jgi:hypothetical protein
MKITEIIAEDIGKISDPHASASQGITRFRDDGLDRTYHLNRVMMAAAMHDGKSTNPVKMDAASWAEKYNTAHPYTDEEHNMIQGALKTIGGDSSEIVPRGKSEELDHVNSASPVRNPGPISLKKKK